MTYEELEKLADFKETLDTCKRIKKIMGQDKEYKWFFKAADYHGEIRIPGIIRDGFEKLVDSRIEKLEKELIGKDLEEI